MHLLRLTDLTFDRVWPVPLFLANRKSEGVSPVPGGIAGAEIVAGP